MDQDDRKAPLVTVYIPTKNRLRLLQRAVNSVLAQTYDEIELVVVDDCSADGTREYLQAMVAEQKLTAILMTASGGACAARNLAIRSARGRFVTGLDDDDYFKPDRIKGFVDKWLALDQDEVSNRIAGLFDGQILLRHDRTRRLANRPKVTFRNLKLGNLIGNQVFAPRDHYIGAGLFDPEMPCWQDWDLWLRLAKVHGDFVGCGNWSYVFDIGSAADRVSCRPEGLIRDGFRRMIVKHGPYTWRERYGPINAIADYPQVMLSLQETLILASFGGFWKVLKKALRRIFGDSLYLYLRDFQFGYQRKQP